MKKWFIHHLFVFCLLPLQSIAGSMQDPQSISEVVFDFLQQHPDITAFEDTKITIRPLDKRLKLTQCEQPLEIQPAPGARLLGKTSIKVQCSAPKPWSIYVSATIERFAPVYVTSNTLKRGHIISNSDIYLSRKNLAQLPFGYITKPSDAIGKQVKRHIQAESVLTPAQLSNPVVIHRGETISLHSSSSHFDIRMKGEALMDGTVGQRIRVKNLSSQRIVEGQVIQAGVVNIAN